MTAAPISPAWGRTLRRTGARAALTVGTATVVGAVAGPAAAATVLVVVLVVLQPVLGRRRYQQLVSEISRDPGARLRHYVSGMLSSWAYVAVVAVIGGLSGRSATSIGLRLHGTEAGSDTQSAAWMAWAAVVLAASTVLIWRAGPRLLDRLRRQLRGFAQLVPRTMAERVAFAGVALTAGFCEEVLYRGFGIAYLRWLDPGMSRPAIVWVIAAAFGLAHLYQGPRNVVATGLAGALLAWMTVSTGTLLPAIVVHCLIDLRVCFLPGRLVDLGEPDRTGLLQ